MNEIKEVDELNKLLNIVLMSENQLYTNGSENIRKCSDKFAKYAEDDDISLKVYLYLFPYSSLEKNEENFWFIKYKNNASYNEYSFSLDLLKLYIEYLSNKNPELFNLNILNIFKKFGTYKFFDAFFSVIRDYTDNLVAVIAYFTKDYKYFNETFEIISLNETFQNLEFIQKLKNFISNKNLNYNVEYSCL